MSKNAGKSEMKQSNKLMRDNIARLEAIGIPTIEAQKIALESPELVGLLEAESIGPSRFEEVQMDPRLQAAQLAALEDVSGIAQTGLGAADQLALEEIRRRAAGQAQAQRATALQQMQERGLGDSGASLVAQLQAGQSAADTAAMQGMQQAAQAQQARMAALGQQANMASGMQGQQLQLAGQKASAADAIAQFNAQNRQSVAAQNLAARQNIANQQAATKNQQEVYNKALIQQKFQNEMAKATGVTGQQSAMAGNLQQQAGAAQQAQQAQTGALLNLGGTLGAAALMSDANAKINIEDFSSDEFLGKLKPYKYDYKNEENGKGKQAGVMAQDLEKTEVGKQAVINTPKGKMVDYGKLGPTMLSSLVELNARIKKLEGK